MNNSCLYQLPIIFVFGFLLFEKKRKLSFLSGIAAAAVYNAALILDWNAWLVAPVFLLFLLPSFKLFSSSLLILIYGSQFIRLLLAASSVSYPVISYLLLLSLLSWVFFSNNWMGFSGRTCQFGKRLSITLFTESALAFCCMQILSPSPAAFLIVLFAGLFFHAGIPRLARLIFFQERARAMMLDLKEQDIKEIGEKREKLASLQSEYSSLLLQVRRHLEMEEYDEAGKLTASVCSAFVHTREHPYSSNASCNALLNLKAAECKEAGIDFEFHCLPLSSSLRTVDICLILSNFLDNAIRACKQQSSPKLCLKMKENKGKILIACTNTCRQDPSALIHQTGFGQQIIRDILKNYHGSLHTQWINEEYRAAAVFYTAETASFRMNEDQKPDTGI